MIEADKLAQGPDKNAQKVVEKAEAALAIWRELNDLAWIARSLSMTGSAQVTLNEYDKALAAYNEALSVCLQNNFRTREGITLLDLGSVAYSQRKRENAVEFYERSLPIFREMKDRQNEAQAFNRLGIAHVTLGRSDKGVENYEHALAISRELNDRPAEAEILTNLAIAYGRLSRNDEAIASFEDSIKVSRELKDRRQEARGLLSLGTTYMFVSNYEKGISSYESAIAISREIKDRGTEATTLTTLGNAYSTIYRYDTAVELLDQALTIVNELNEPVEQGRTLYGLGAAHLGLNNNDKGIDYLRQALASVRASGDRPVEAATLLQLGNAIGKGGQHAESIKYYDEALAIYRQFRVRPHEGSTLNRLGSAYREIGQLEKAIEHTTQALSIAREIRNPQFEAQSLSLLGKIENDRGNLDEAQRYLEQSLAISEKLRSDIVNLASRTSILSSLQTTYRLYTDVLMRRHKAEPEKGFDALALDNSERQRARSLLDLITESNIDVRQGVDSGLIASERAIAKQLNEKAGSRTTTPQQAESLKLEISKLETELERAQDAIHKATPHYANLTQAKPLKLKEIQAQLDDDTQLLEYSLGEQRSYLWSITKDSLASYELPKEETIAARALDVYKLLSARNSKKNGETAFQRRKRVADADAKLPEASQALSQILLAPVAGKLGSKRVVIVADGELQYIPFAMLPMPLGDEAFGPGDRKPLIVSNEVVTIPSASVLAIQRTELAGRQSAPKTLAVIADPVFDRSDTRVKLSSLVAINDAGGQRKSDTRGLEHIAETDEAGRPVIKRLPFTRTEAERLMSLAPQTTSFKETDFSANRDNVLSGDLAQYRYIHFATHGFLDTERPGLSALILSMVDQNGGPRDGFLRANDIYNMRLPAELVVLSACQTGLGKDVKGEGLIGLTRGFMYAGARRVVVSLWSVNDKATSDLMAKFYRGMLKDNERPAAALRAAQIEMWKQKKWQSPYYWAAFTMQGEWN
jgi:CHAT domain-containing protein/tetratricopeptide (TPR) repeat protein